MSSLDRIRRIHIVRALTVFFIGLGIGYLLPEILGLIVKLRTPELDQNIRPWEVAMQQLPIRIVHIIGLVISGIAAIYLFRISSLRFMEPREGEA